MALGRVNMSRTELCNRAKFQTSYLSQVIRGLKQPSDKFYMLVAQNLSVNEHWLRTGEGDMLAAETELHTATHRGDKKVVGGEERSAEYSITAAEMQVLITEVMEVLRSRGTYANALRENIHAFHQAVQTEARIAALERSGEENREEIAKLQRQIDTLMALLHPAEPPGEAKAT